MLDNKERARRASQPFIRTVPSTQAPLLRSSSFLLARLKTWHPQTDQTISEAFDSNSSFTRRICGDLSDDENNVDVLSIPTRQSADGVAEEQHNGIDFHTKTSLHLWKRFVPQPKPQANQVTLMYSISFYPWKMEPHCYYSHPEAAANWVPDTASSRCQICLVSFTLTRRRHHCRLCGHLVCANCSHDRTYLPFAGSAPSQHRLIKDGAPQRTCRTCASTLRNMAGQDDPRVKRFTVAVSSKGVKKHTEASTASVEVEIERPSLWMRRTGVGLTDYDMEDEEFFTESTKSLQLERRSHENTLQFPLRLSVTRAEELDEILSARACSRLKSALDRDEKSGNKHFVMSSAWLNQWLQYVRVNSTSADATPPRIGQGTRQSKKFRLARPPRPGPVTNYALLDFVNGELVPKHTLRQSKGNYRKGDYRVVSQEVWLTFLEIYGGGPSIQVPIQEDADHSTLVADHSCRSPTYSQWIITELDDSMAALVGSSSGRTTETRPGASFYQTEPKAVYSRSSRLMLGTRSASARCLFSDAPLPSIVKHITAHCSLHSESPQSSGSSHWQLGEERSRATSKCDVTFDAATVSQHCELADASSSLTAVSAFASAATLARQRSAASLSQHPAATSGRP